MRRSVVHVGFGVGIDPAIWTEVENLVEVVLTGGRADRKARSNGGSRLVICKLPNAERRPRFGCAASSLLESPGVPRTARAKQRKNGCLQFRQQGSLPIPVHAFLAFFSGWSRRRTRPEFISKTAPTSFLRPSRAACCPSGVSINCFIDHRTLASTAWASCSWLERERSFSSDKPGTISFTRV